MVSHFHDSSQLNTVLQQKWVKRTLGDQESNPISATKLLYIFEHITSFLSQARKVDLGLMDGCFTKTQISTQFKEEISTKLYKGFPQEIVSSPLRLFLYVLAFCISPSGKFLFIFFVYFSIGVFDFLLPIGSFYIFIFHQLYKYFLQVYCFSSTLVFCCIEALNFSIFSLVVHVFSVLL